MEKFLKQGRLIDEKWCNNNCSPECDEKKIDMLLLLKSQQKKSEARDKAVEMEIFTAVTQLPPNLQRLVTLNEWVKDIAVPFEQATGLLFTTKDHKLERDEVCRGCEYMVKENDLMSCSKCGCRMGKLIADGSEPDPHELMGKLGQKGKTADAVRIKSASWYAAKKCGNWQDEDKWQEVDKKYMSEDNINQRNALYKD